jgi:ribonucleoside-diphosphate reductase alpha chain
MEKGNQDSHTVASARQMALKTSELCPECGEASVVNEEGCRKCYNCGYSEC